MRFGVLGLGLKKDVKFRAKDSRLGAFGLRLAAHVAEVACAW